VAHSIGVSRPTVWRWQERFAESGVDGLPRDKQRHRHLEFSRFLKAVERKVTADKPIRVILDNYATHKYPKVLA
jgi:transposase